MSQLQVPVIATVTGEGGSGGALAIGVADRVNMLEYSIYSVIAPESCSAILWRDQDHAAEAAEALKITPEDLRRFNLIDDVIPEPEGGAHTDHAAMAETLGKVLDAQIRQLESIPVAKLIQQRYDKFRAMGAFAE
jgi:acetyl-CoA carboxylase carboxyl transferase subunit alpha